MSRFRGQPIRTAVIGDYKLDPPEPPEGPEDGCPECGSYEILEDKAERIIECGSCGEIIAAFDWDAEAERRAEARAERDEPPGDTW